MLDNEKVIKFNKINYGLFFSSIIKSIIVLLIIGIIMFALSLWGAQIYSNLSNSYNHGSNSSGSSSGFVLDLTTYYYLNPIYGIIGIIIYIAINYFSFLLYNEIIKKFKNYKSTIGKVMYILFSIFINILMLIIYLGLFGRYSFENILLEFLNEIIINFGYISFPIVSAIFYIYKKVETRNF